MRKHLFTLFLLLTATVASAQYKIHILHPGANDTARVKQPVLLISPNVAGLAHPGTAMTPEGDNWYTYTIPENAIPANTPVLFFFATTAPTPFNPTAGHLSYFNGGQQFNFATIFKEAGVKEIWITTYDLDGTRPPLISDLPPGKKVVYILNPWPQSAPAMRVGATGAYTLMRGSSDTARCGWYFFPVRGNDFNVHFKNNLGDQTYGRTGINGTTSIDLTVQFAAKDTVYLLPVPSPDGPPDIRTVFPGTKQACSFPLAIQVRDFSKGHPDFEGGSTSMGDAVRKGMVQETLGPDRKPVKGPTPHAGFQTLFNWFTSDGTEPVETDRGYPTCIDLPMKKDKDGYFAYDSYTDSPSKSFFPIDGFRPFPTASNNERSKSKYRNRGATGGYPNDPTNGDHNFHFCMEMHADFTYERGQKFEFEGDDDMWVFVNNKLALDLGGTHDITTGGINMDSLATKLGLKVGEKYPFDMFYCERQTDGSNLLVKTSIHFQQPSVILDRVVVNGVVTYKVREVKGKDRSCDAVAVTDSIVDAPSKFILNGPGLTAPEELKPGVSHGGVIAINGARYEVTVDTTKSATWDLRPGTYTIDFVTDATGRAGQIKFTIPGSYVTEFADKRPVVYTGELAAVSIVTVLNGAPDPRADTVKLTIPPGLQVFLDSAKTQPIATGGSVVIPATGTQRIFVTSNAPGTYTLELLGGPTKAIRMDTESFTFEKQLKVTLTASPTAPTYVSPTLSVTLTANPAAAAVWYTLDGSDPTTSTTRIRYAGPFTLTGNPAVPATTVKAYATAPSMIDSDVLTVTYTYTPPAGVRRAWYSDKDGDGRIETVSIEFDKALPAAPAKLGFAITDARGVSESRTAEGAQIALSGAAVTVTLASPFAYGITSVTNRGSSGQLFAQANIPLFDGAFAIDDSVAPVLIRAEVKEPDSVGNPHKRVILELSEDVVLPAAIADAVVFKREGAELPAGQVALLPPALAGRQLTLSVDALNTAVFPIVGDSVALAPGGVRDVAAGRSPERKLFKPLEGVVPKPKPMALYVAYPNRTKDLPSAGVTATGGGHFVPIATSGAALAGSAADGKCTGCVVFDGTTYAGPVIHIETSGPVDYDFKLFNNLGEFVASGKGRITQDDLPQVRSADPSGMRYVVRVVWTGINHKGVKAGTGAYILQSVLTGAKDMTTGAPPARETRRVTFGLLRGI